MTTVRSRWAAVGAAVAVTLGAGGVSLGQASIGSGDKPVFVAITPCRLVDTRPGDNNVGGRTSPLTAGDTLTLQVTGATGECTGIPAGAVAAALNVTAIQGSTRSFLTLYPADAPLPNASNLNWNGGDPPTPNKVDVKLSAAGAVKITNAFGTVHVAADLAGYYVDHHHDDRYYTKSQTDDRYYTKAAVDGAFAALPWSDSLPVESAYMEGGASYTIGGGGSITGLWMPQGVFSRIGVGWTLPSDYAPGTSLQIRMTWARRPGIAGSCTFRLRSNGASIYRSGVDPIYPSSGFAPDTPGTDFSGATALMPYPTTNSVQELVIDIPGTRFDGAATMQPGDHMSYLFFRDGANAADTCTAASQAFVVLGMSVEAA